MSLPKLKGPVVVDWIDSCSSGRWNDISVYQQIDPLVCKSTGWVVRSDKKVMTLVQSIGKNGTMADSITIPRVCIKRVRRLR